MSEHLIKVALAEVMTTMTMIVVDDHLLILFIHSFIGAFDMCGKSFEFE